MVIFKRKNMPKETFPTGVLIHVHPKGWMDEEGVILWLNQIWSKVQGSLNPKHALLVWDQFGSHLTEKVKRRLEESRKVIPAVIPGGLRSMLQPLDVCLNKPFKSHVREYWHAWMFEGKGRVTPKGNLARPELSTVVTWVKEAWNKIPCEMIVKSFLKTSIANSLDGTQDDILWEDDSEKSDDSESDDEDGSADWCSDMKTGQQEWEDLFGASDSDEEDFDGF
jgi:hypothetical protein